MTSRDRVNAEIMHFYAKNVHKMDFQLNLNASWDTGHVMKELNPFDKQSKTA